MSRLHSKELVDAAWRREQAHVNAAIEGLAHDADIDRLVAEMDVAGMEPCKRIERSKDCVRNRQRNHEIGGARVI